MKIKFLYLILCTLLFVVPVFADSFNQTKYDDTSEVIKINKQAYNNRLTDASQTIEQAKKSTGYSGEIEF